MMHILKYSVLRYVPLNPPAPGETVLLNKSSIPGDVILLDKSSGNLQKCQDINSTNTIFSSSNYTYLVLRNIVGMIDFAQDGRVDLIRTDKFLSMRLFSRSIFFINIEIDAVLFASNTAGMDDHEEN